MESERRPSPEQMLERAKGEEAERKRGKLRVFFGAAPGVGKTYGMLQAAHQRREEGLNVLVGWVETHGRRETEALLEGLELLPARQIAYRGVTLHEFDVDAALERHPALLIVDELAHSNAPGSRNAYRWQDIGELLDAGIDVYTTLNVQHLESLNPVVNQITGVQVRETVPDSLFDRADEVELIDLPTDDLLQRLREGKVYVPPQAERAIEQFFRKHNLVALRELSLQRTAERVDVQVTRAKRDAGITQSWPTRERLLVAIGPSPLSANLIRSAYRMANRLQARWIALAVESPDVLRLDEAERERMEENIALADRLGAETLVVSGESVADAILQVANQRNVNRIIVGKADRPSWRDRLRPSLSEALIRGSGGIDVLVTRGEPEPVRPRPRPAVRRHAPALHYLWTALLIAGVTGAGLLARPILDQVDVGMMYLLATLLVASRSSRGPSLLASIASVATFDFFFVLPHYTFAVADIRYAITFAVLLATGLIVSGLTLRIRRQAEAARDREQRITLLHNLTRSFAYRRGVQDISTTAVNHMSVLYGVPAVLFLPDAGGHLIAQAGGTHPFAQSEHELTVARWVYLHGRPAGYTTDTLPESEALYLPLGGGDRVLGVMGIALRQRDPLTPSLRSVLELFTGQAALALERALLEDTANKQRVDMESERLRSALLTAISHDLRTPLAAITGAVSGLSEESGITDPTTRNVLAATIGEQVGILNAIVQDILDLTRLESGTVQPKREPWPVEELVHPVLARLRTRLQGRDVGLRVDDPALAVEVDAVLIEQVLVNLLENALNYTPEGTPIDIVAEATGHGVTISVLDRGDGIPATELERIFDKFHRLDRAAHGTGLGLSICRAILTAHGGRIWAENRPGGGAAFRFEIPSVAGKHGTGMPPA